MAACAPRITDYVVTTCSEKQGGDRQQAPRKMARAAPRNDSNPLKDLTTDCSECAEDVTRRPGDPCSSQNILDAVVAFVEEFAVPAVPASPAVPAAASLLPTAATVESEAVRKAAAFTDCPSESCLYRTPVFQQFVVNRGLVPGARALKRELELRFKAGGPRDSLDLLSNYNLDETLQRWGRVFPTFFPCPFAMMDFDNNGDYFGEANLPAILEGRIAADLGTERVRRPFNCFGCIVNTDTSSGPGKHWVAVFVDCRPGGSDPWTVEYFNSAGRPPPKPMIKWMERTAARLAEYRTSKAGPLTPEGVAVTTVAVTDVDHQESQTECGLYALFYIRRRLEGAPYKLFFEQLVPDAAMTEFRKHVFRDS
jgi:hypothetical protein